MNSQLPKLSSKLKTHKYVGDSFWVYIWIDIYIFYILTKYKEIWRTLLIFHPSHPYVNSPSGLRCRSALTRKLSVLRVSAHEFVFFSFSSLFLGFSFLIFFCPLLLTYLRMDGMGWMDGMEYQKCPSNFFILCGYIEHVYTYLYIYTENF